MREIIFLTKSRISAQNRIRPSSLIVRNCSFSRKKNCINNIQKYKN